MTYILTVRLPSGGLVVLEKEAGTAIAAEYDSEAEAAKAADDNLLCLSYGYDIVVIDA